MGITPNLMPDERIVYRARAGKLSFSRYLPSSTVIVTNKRLLVYKPIRLFSKQRAFYYDRIESVSVKRGIVASTFVVSTELEGGHGNEILFYNSTKLLSLFGIVSNQVQASKDPHYAEKVRAHSLDTRYAVLNSTQQFHADKRSEVQLSGFVRSVQGEEAVYRVPVEKIPAPAAEAMVQKSVEASAARPKLTLGVNTVLSITQKLQKHFNMSSLHPQRVEVGYFAAGEELFKPGSTIEEEESAKQPEIPRQKPVKQQGKLNPDRELHIFRIRKLRASKLNGTSANAQVPYQFNLFNTK